MKNPEHDNTPDSEECKSCNGRGKIYYSQCCGALIKPLQVDLEYMTICSDCHSPCEWGSEICEECHGEGSIEYDEEQAREEYLDLKEHQATGN